MKTAFVALLLVGVSAAYTVIPDDYNELVKLVFGTAKERKVEHARRKRETQIEYENRVCECVPYYQCNYQGNMNEDGEGIIDIRTGFVGTVDNPTSTRRPCDHYLSVCCLPPELLPGRENPSNPGGNGGHPNPGGNGGQGEYPNPGGNGEQGGHPNPGGNGGQGEYPNPGGNGGQGGHPNPGGNGGQGEYPNPGGNGGQGEYPNPGGNGGHPNPGGNGGQGEYPNPGDNGGHPNPGGNGGQGEYPNPGGNGGHPNPGGNGGQGEYPNQGGNGGKVDPPNQGGHGGENGGGVFGKPHNNRGCGYRNPNGVGFRITGNYNNEANFAEFPWVVAVLKEDNIKGNLVKVYQCGGSLIHRRVVLTAAHCVHGKVAKQLSIRAGEWDTQTTDEPLPHQDRSAVVVATHPGYKPGSLHNDYALIILSQPVDLADNVEVVCLPQEYENFDHTNCFATGWGKDKFGEEGRYQVILKSIELPTVPHDKCEASLRTTRLGKYFKLNESFMCAGGVNGVDACTGDGGSPLICPLPQDPNRYTQAGIVAWGIGCGENGVPGVYADITKGRRWIDETLAGYNIDSLSYSPGANNNYPPVQG